jgi:hypothetical protein
MHHRDLLLIIYKSQCSEFSAIFLIYSILKFVLNSCNLVGLSLYHIKKKLHKNAMTKPHKFEVNSTQSGSLTNFEFFSVKKWSKYKNKILFTVGDPNLSSIPYRTVPFSVRAFFTLAASKREAYRFFCLKFTVFPLKKSKARTVPYLKLRPF